MTFSECGVYNKPMGKAKVSSLEKPVPVRDEEDEATLAAIDEGIREAEAGKTVSLEQARKVLPKWTSASSSRKER
jgi:predicted transcriptional regulator